MARRLEGRDAIEVYPTERGQIVIKQDGSIGEEDALVILDPNDVPTIIEWLQEAAVDATELRTMWLEKQDEEPIKVGE